MFPVEEGSEFTSVGNRGFPIPVCPAIIKNMKEEMGLTPKPQNEGKVYKLPTPEEIDHLEKWIADNPEEEVPMELRRDYEKEKDELEALFVKFEQDHSLEKLHEIGDLSSELFSAFTNPKGFPVAKNVFILPTLSEKESIMFITRETAKKDLVPIVSLLNSLKNMTNIPKSEYEALREIYKKLSRAVCMIRGKQVVHTH